MDNLNYLDYNVKTVTVTFGVKNYDHFRKINIQKYFPSPSISVDESCLGQCVSWAFLLLPFLALTIFHLPLDMIARLGFLHFETFMKQFYLGRLNFFLTEGMLGKSNPTGQVPQATFDPLNHG